MSFKDEYRAMRSTERERVAATNARDAEMLARVYRRRPDNGVSAFCAGMPHIQPPIVEREPRKKGGGLGVRGRRKLAAKDAADRKMYRRASARAAVGARPVTLTGISSKVAKFLWRAAYAVVVPASGIPDGQQDRYRRDVEATARTLARAWSKMSAKERGHVRVSIERARRGKPGIDYDETAK